MLVVISIFLVQAIANFNSNLISSLLSINKYDMRLTVGAITRTLQCQPTDVDRETRRTLLLSSLWRSNPPFLYVERKLLNKQWKQNERNSSFDIQKQPEEKLETVEHRLCNCPSTSQRYHVLKRSRLY